MHVYREPHWYQSRDRIIPLGTQAATTVEAPAGKTDFLGFAPVISTEQVAPIVKSPIMVRRLQPIGGVYHMQFMSVTRIAIIAPQGASAAGADVTINVPEAAITFEGKIPQLLDQAINVPLANLTFDGLPPEVNPQPGGTRRQRQIEALIKTKRKKS